MDELEKAIEERRKDKPFMDRLKKNMEKHKPLLDRLRDSDGPRTPDQTDQ